jgi:hypothetical protein
MNALVIAPHMPDTYAFIDGLHAATHCRVRHNHTIQEGLRTMEQAYCDIVLVAMDSASPAVSKIIDLIRLRAIDLLVRPPDVILLFNGSLPIPDALRCRELGAIAMRRDVPLAVFEEARLAFWKRATRKHEVTLRVDYRNGHHSLFVGSSPVRIELGAQLTRIAVLLLGGNESYTVEWLADELEICRQSVKKYICDLRRVLITTCGQGIFWMEKRPGGSVCGARANAVWN